MVQRAEQYATLLCSGCHIKADCKQHCISWYNRKTKYLFIAKEQEPISYLKGRSDAFAEMAEIMEQDKRRIIDKALKLRCELLCIGFRDTGRCFVDGKCSSYHEIKRRLEEE